MNPAHFWQIAQRELSQALCRVNVSVNSVPRLPIVDAKQCLENIHLSSFNSDRYWIPWTEEIGAWVDGKGRNVDIVISEDFDEDEVESSLANFMTAVVMGACFNLQGSVAIHANAVALINVAAAFVGYSGRGKSTLTAYCVSRDARFVTDDVLSVDSFNKVNIGYPRVKLYPHTGESLGVDTSEDSDYKIHYHPQQLGGVIQQQPIPLGVIYLLEDSSDRIYSEQISSSQAVFDLLTHSYYASQLIHHNPALLDTYVQLVTQTPVKKLFYPRKMAMLPKVYDFLLKEIEQL